MAVLDASHPRGLRLARRVSSCAVFVIALLIFTGLFTIEGVAQEPQVSNFAVAPGDGQLKLTWGPNSTWTLTLKHYEYASSHNTNWTNVDKNTTTATITGLTNGTSYNVQMRAEFTNGDHSFDITETGKTPNIAAPTGLTATAGDGEVKLSWTAVPASDWTTTQSSDTYYQYSKNNGTDWTKIPNSTKTTATYTVTGLTNGTSYTFRVRAHGAGGGGKQSNSQTATPMLSVPAAPTNLQATPGDRKITVSWDAPSGTVTGYEFTEGLLPTWHSTGSKSTTYTLTGLRNGNGITISIRAVNVTAKGAAATTPEVTPNIPAPTGLTATAGNGEVRLSWTKPSDLNPASGAPDLSYYQYTTDDGTNWTSTGGTSITYTVTGLNNGTPYTFKVRAVRVDPHPESGGTSNGLASESASATPQDSVVLPPPPPPPPPPPLVDTNTNPPRNINAGTTETLTVQRVNRRTVTLSWDIPTALNAQTIAYEYSTDGGGTWTSTGSTNTSITLTGDGFGNLPPAQFKIRAMNMNADGTQSFVIISAPATQPQRGIRYECPVGWTRGSIFGNTKRALIYELKVNVDLTNTISIYQLKSLAIYVHPEEDLETLEGWYLTTGILYNHDHENKFQLTAENSVIDEHGFAHIENPEAIPIRMGTLGFIGQSLPSFDYRLYDERGARVDFGISCYKEGGLTFRLWNTEDPRVLRVLPFSISEAALDVQMRNLDWNTPFFRTQWTAAIMPDLPDAPAAPSLIKKNIVGTWADLKKQ